MTSSPTAALAGRLREVAPLVLAAAPPPVATPPEADAGMLLDLLAGAVCGGRPAPGAVWLVLVAFDAVWPVPEAVDEARRQAELLPPDDWALWVASRRTGPAPARSLRVLHDAVVVDVDHLARNDTHTGIQQVLRRTLPVWDAETAVTFVAWHRPGSAPRPLTAAETDRVVRWHGRDTSTAGPADVDEPEDVVVVPWGGVLVVADVPDPTHAREIVAATRSTPLRVGVLGYDCIPVLSPQLLPPGAAGGFARWLDVVKHASHVACISRASAAEFAGFAAMTRVQGLPGPTVVACPLPTGREAETPGRPRRPVVLTVGSFEPRKNHLAVLAAAERLWGEGLEFEVVMIGGNVADSSVADRIAELQRAGRPVTQLHKVAQAVVDEAYRTARVVAFPSLHEGFGLPVAEALAVGTPVLTSSTGSTAEIVADGGGVAVDPRDDDALTDGLRRLLVDDDLWDELHAQIARRPTRSWTDYARELWAVLVAPTPLPTPVEVSS